MTESLAAYRARHQRDLALEVLGLEIGDRVWYWNWPQGEDPQWVEAVVFGAGGKDGHPVVDVKLIDQDLPEHYIGFRKWGYGWAVTPWTEERPDPPKEEEKYP